LLPTYRHSPHLHSFPTRRSSDLSGLLAMRDGKVPENHDLLKISCIRLKSYTVSHRGARCRAGGRIRDRPRSSAPARLLLENRRRSEEHTSELQSLAYLVCRLLLE